MIIMPCHAVSVPLTDDAKDQCHCQVCVVVTAMMHNDDDGDDCDDEGGWDHID